MPGMCPVPALAGRRSRWLPAVGCQWEPRLWAHDPQGSLGKAHKPERQLHAEKCPVFLLVPLALNHSLPDPRCWAKASPQCS